MGRDRATMAEPLSELSVILEAIEATRQARQALAVAGSPPLDGIPDIRPAVARCGTAGTVLEGNDLISLLPVLETSARLASYGNAVRAEAPDVETRSRQLPRLDRLRASIRRALDDDGAVTDQASPRLGQVRRQIRARRERLVADLERMLQSHEADRLFADRFVTVRHGRYVLPVRAEARARVRGIVHDRSQSGQTIFVEPEQLVDANNDLVELLREEEQETARVLAELTDLVRERLGDVEALVEAIGELDWIFARAHTADRMAATAPRIDTGRTVALKSARHPLLVAQTWSDPSRSVVPVDIELAADRPLLLITGPNAGGKTIVLKTLALCSLMAQVGCHVPAADGSRLPVFPRLFAIIGDDQSVAENLSTFSAFVKQIKGILAEAEPGSLVLLDELGAGTDPDEGAALAQAILEALDAAGALVVATTHLEPLKAFASTHPRLRNASVEFDTERLAPTFRLRYDRPGQSYALAIAGRLGLSPELIARAQSHRTADAARMSALIAWLDEHTRCEAERTIAMERRETESAARLAAAGEAETNAAAQARQIIERARAEAAALLGEIRRAITAEWDRLKHSDRSRKSIEESRSRVRDAAAKVAETAPPPAMPGGTAALEPGEMVQAEHLGVRGEIVAITGSTATVRSGSVTVRVPVSALRRAEDARSGSRGGGETAPGPVWSKRHRNPGFEGGRARDSHAGPGVVSPPPRAIASEILLLGRTTDEARDIVEKYLDDAFLAGLGIVRLIHGKGSGALRKAVRDLLAAHPLVESFRDGEPAEGGLGATVASLKVS
jgi:DNA mismatch repair protein MutS2